MINLEQKRKRIENIAKVVALAIVAFFVAPFVVLTIKGLVGMIAAFAIGSVGIAFIPWFSATVANWRLKAIKYEASKNPIETLENDWNARKQMLLNFADAIRKGAASVANFRDKLDDFKKSYPEDSEKFDHQLSQMQALLELRKSKYNQAKDELERFDGEIEKARAIWTLSKAAAEMNAAAGDGTEEFFAKIQVETALDSVQTGLNTAFADLELSLMDEAPKKPAAEPAKALPSTKKKLTIKTSGKTSDLSLNV